MKFALYWCMGDVHHSEISMPIQSVTIDVNTSTLGDQEQPDGIVLKNGNILVAWFDPIGPDGTEAGSSIRGQLVSPDGVFVGSELLSQDLRPII